VISQDLTKFISLAHRTNLLKYHQLLQEFNTDSRHLRHQ